VAYHHAECPPVSSQATGERGQVSMCNKDGSETDVVGRVAVIIHTTKKRCCCILADILPKKKFTAWMITHEAFQIMNESCNA